MKILIIIFKSIAVLLIAFGLLSVILFAFGYRPAIVNPLPDWNAVSAIATCVGVLVAVFIPIAVLHIQKKMDADRKAIGDSNIELLKEMEAFKNEYFEKLKILTSLVGESGKINIDAGTWDTQDASTEGKKEKALKFINISMFASTGRIAKHLEISEKEAYELLVEMLRSDASISAAGQVRENNSSLTWMPKRKK